LAAPFTQRPSAARRHHHIRAAARIAQRHSGALAAAVSAQLQAALEALDRALLDDGDHAAPRANPILQMCDARLGHRHAACGADALPAPHVQEGTRAAFFPAVRRVIDDDAALVEREAGHVLAARLFADLSLFDDAPVLRRARVADAELLAGR
jgi:hypothetical protein